MSTIIENLKAIRARLTKSTASVTADVATLRAQIREKRAELTRLPSRPVPKIDTDRNARQMVESAGASFLAHEGTAVLSSIGGTGSGRRLPWVDPDGGVKWGALCAAAPDFAVNLLTNLVARVEYEPGPPLSDRPGLIAKLEAEIREIEAGEERLVDEACEAGLVIAHRPEVVQRRQNEARQAELDAQRVADRAARQAALNAHHASRPRTGRSGYLAAAGAKPAPLPPL